MASYITRSRNPAIYVDCNSTKESCHPTKKSDSFPKRKRNISANSANSSTSSCSSMASTICDGLVKTTGSSTEESDSSNLDTPSRNLRSSKPNNDPLKLRFRKSMLDRGKQAAELEKNTQRATITKTETRRKSVMGRGNACMDSINSSSDDKEVLRLRIRKSMLAKAKVEQERENNHLVSVTEECNTPDKNISTSVRKSPKKAKKEYMDVEPLTGRTEEFNSICNWIHNSMEENSPLSIYISGAPGTGKTATVSLVMEKLKHSVVSIVVNCVSVKTQALLVSAIMESQGWSGKNTLATLSEHLKRLTKPILLVLDEIDHLATKSNSILYSAFGWPSSISSNVMLIGIANSIDLTERLLPKLKLNVPPKTLVFVPYLKETIVSILKNKIDNEKSSLDSKAVELCARKVAAMSGDLRTALHIYKASKSNNDMGSGSNGIREVLGVLNSVYASPLARAKLPFQSRLMLAICLKLSTAKKAVLTRNSLFPVYELACSTLKLPALDFDERRDAFGVLENQSFISVSSDGKIRLMVDSKTAQIVVADNKLIEQVAMLKL